MTIQWKRIAPGFYRGSGPTGGEYTISRQEYDDGAWWIVTYPDGSSGDTAFTMAEARGWAEADAAGY